jgi:hypothetical protein
MATLTSVKRFIVQALGVNVIKLFISIICSCFYELDYLSLESLSSQV